MQPLTIHTMVLFDAILFCSSSDNTVLWTINCLMMLSVIPLVKPWLLGETFSMELERCIKLG